MRGLTPILQVTSSAEAIAWYAAVFGARELRARLVAPDGTCMSAVIEVEGARLMLADEAPSMGSVSPARHQATSVVLNLHVADVDHTFARAVAKGAVVISPPADQFFGDRSGRLRDPFGHHWIVATSIREVPDEEMLAAFEALFG